MDILYVYYTGKLCIMWIIELEWLISYWKVMLLIGLCGCALSYWMSIIDHEV